MDQGLTFRDVLLVPQKSFVKSRQHVQLHTFFSKNVKLDNPVIPANMDTITEAPMATLAYELGSIGIIHRFLPITIQSEQVRQVLRARPHAQVGASVGVVGDYLVRLEDLKRAGAAVIVVDVAHAHAQHVLEAVKKIRDRLPNTDLVVGNVATPEGVSDLIGVGVDGIKVGVGPGATCATRVVAGAGVPQLTAIMQCAAASSVPICADGGIRDSGDVVKALAAGASTVMVGRLFAGTTETPGEVTEQDGFKYKVYRGMASQEASAARTDRTTASVTVPEGVKLTVPSSGSARLVFDQLTGGVRSGMSYVGAHTLTELHQRAKFIQITPAGWEESVPRN